MGQKGFIFWIILPTILVAVAAVLYFNSLNSLPGDVLYPIKGVKENLRLGANDLSFEGRAAAYTDFTNTRYKELRAIIEQQRSVDKIRETLQKLTESQKKALDNIEKARSRGTNMTIYLEDLNEILKTQYQGLQDLLYQVPNSLYDSVNQAIEETSTRLKRIEELLND